MSKLDSVKRKIQALAAKTTENGCSEAEALTAASMLNKLLQEYNLDMSEAMVRESEVEMHEIDTKQKRMFPIFDTIPYIAELFNCEDVRTHTNNYGGTIRYKFFGFQQDVIAATTLYKVIEIAVEQETKKFQLTEDYKEPVRCGVHWRQVKLSFQRGMVQRVNERLSSMTKKNVIENQASTGNALVVIKKEMVLKALNLAFPKLKSFDAPSAGRNLGDVYLLGRAAGDKILLNDNKLISNQ